MRTLSERQGFSKVSATREAHHSLSGPRNGPLRKPRKTTRTSISHNGEPAMARRLSRHAQKDRLTRDPSSRASEHPPPMPEAARRLTPGHPPTPNLRGPPGGGPLRLNAPSSQRRGFRGWSKRQPIHS